MPLHSPSALQDHHRPIHPSLDLDLLHDPPLLRLTHASTRRLNPRTDLFPRLMSTERRVPPPGNHPSRPGLIAMRSAAFSVILAAAFMLGEVPEETLRGCR